MPTLIKRAESMALVLPSGELRQGTTDEFIDAVTHASGLDVKTVVVSMREVTALLSEGIRSLVMLRDQVTDAGQTFYLTDLPVDVRYTLKITNLLEFLNHVDTAEEILQPAGLDLGAFEEVSREEPAAPEPADTPAPATEDKPKRRLPRKYQAFGASASDGKEEAEASSAEDDGEDTDVTRLIKRHVPGRLALEIIEFFLRSHESVQDVKSLAKELGANEAGLRKTADDLCGRGVLKEMAPGNYNYAPEPELNDQLHALVEEWHTPTRQPHLLSLLLKMER